MTKQYNEENMMNEHSGRINIDQIIHSVERFAATGNRSNGVEGDFPSRLTPDDPEFERWFEKGADLLDDGAYEQAVEAFSRAIELFPENPYTYANRARCYWALGEFDHAEDDLLQALRRDASDMETFVCLGEVLTQNERYDEGIKVLHAAVSQLKNVFPEIRQLIGERAHYHLALAQLAVNDLDNALGNALQALLSAPESPFVYDLLGKIRLALGDNEDALKDLHKAITIEKNDADLYVSRSRIYMAAGDERRADVDLKSAVALTSGNADAAVALGCDLMDLENTGWSLESFSNAIRLEHDNALALYYRAYLTAEEDSKAAFSDIEQALKADPGMIDAHMMRGYLLNSLGRADEALLSFKTGVSLDPADAENQAVLGEALLEMQQFHEALTCFELALKLDARCDDACLGRATLFSNLGDHASALADAETVLQRDAGNVKALYIRGVAMMEMGKTDDAVADFELALQSSDRDDRAHSLTGLALALMEKGSMDEASARLDEAGSIDPDEAEIHYARALLGEKLGNYDHAALHIAQALQADDADDRYHELHGEILAAKGDAIAARAAFEKALQLALSRKDKQALRDRIAEL